MTGSALTQPVEATPNTLSHGHRKLIRHLASNLGQLVRSVVQESTGRSEQQEYFGRGDGSNSRIEQG